MNKEILLSRLKLFKKLLTKKLSLIGNRFLSLINQRITLIFFAKEENRSTELVWDLKKIFVFGVIFLLGSILGGHYLITRNLRNKSLDTIKAENLKLDSQIGELEKRIKTISTYQTKYNEQMLKIYQHFGDINGKSVWEKASRNQDVELIRNTWNLENTDWLNSPEIGRPLNAIEQINQSRIQLLLNLNQLKEIDQYMTLVEKISDKIPTGWPIKNNIGYKTSGFGSRPSPFADRREFHTGVDIAAAPGNDLLATADGVVLFSGVKGTFGNVIIIRHDFGYRTIYGHNKVNLVKSSETIKKNQVIGKVGNTGRSTGSHVHYEIRIGKQYVDPWPYIVSKF